MAYEEKLAQRVRKALGQEPGYEEKKMFGGICFLLNGNMACGILNDELIVRVGPENYEDALKKANTRKFDITGRPMTGWVMVGAAGLQKEKQLQRP